MANADIAAIFVFLVYEKIMCIGITCKDLKKKRMNMNYITENDGGCEHT